MKKLELYFNGKIPSGNVFDRGGANWRTRWVRNQKLISDWGWLIKQTLQRFHKDTPFYLWHKYRIDEGDTYFRKKVKCNVLRFYTRKGKKYDDANLTHSVDKLIIDGLVKEKILIDDSPVYFCWGMIRQEKSDKDMIMLALEEITNETFKKQ